jgi:Domain of unknown function (DUF6265)
MRNIVSVITILFLPSLSACQPARAEEKMKQMEWLIGNWTRTNAASGKSGYEIWNRRSSTEWHGRGISMKGPDTTFVEVIKIVIEKDTLWYVADVPGNEKKVYFEITRVTRNSFVCENPTHDFPKKIAYQFDGREIRARVSDGDKGIDYVFVRTP